MKYVKVKDLGQIITGNTPPTTDDSYYGDFMPFIKATDIQLDSRYTYITEQCYSEKSYNKYKANLVPKGSTCIVTIGSIGKKMTQAHTDLFVNQAINAILPNERYDKDYVYYVTRYAVLPQLKIYDSGTTSGRENISKSSFSNIRLFVEDNINIQQKKASILSAYDNLIENNNKRIRLLEQMAENLYKEWFVRFRFPGHEKVEFENGLPKGWMVKNVQEWCNVFTGKKDVNQTIPNGKYAFFSCSPEMFKSNDYIYDGKAILVAGNGSYTGRTRYYEGKFDLYQRTYAIVSKRDDSDFLYYLFARFKFDFEKKYSGGTRGSAIPYIVMKDLTRYKFLYEDNVVKKYISIIRPIFHQIVILKGEITTLTRQRDLLLPRLMSGKLEVKQ